MKRVSGLPAAGALLLSARADESTAMPGIGGLVLTKNVGIRTATEGSPREMRRNAIDSRQGRVQVLSRHSHDYG